jgi:hypothetical protein
VQTDTRKVPSYDSELAIGNQLGTIDFGFDFKIKQLKLFLYRQSLYEQGAALLRLANIKDGLNGITLSTQVNELFLKLNLAFFYSQNQGKDPLLFTKEIGWELENYFTHYLYTNGWTYKGKTVGIPLITTCNETNQVFRQSNQLINNNRVKAWLPTLTLKFKNGLFFTYKYIYSENRGIMIQRQESSEFLKQSSFLGTVSLPSKSKISYCFKLSYDKGSVFNNSIGLLGSINLKL